MANPGILLTAGVTLLSGILFWLAADAVRVARIRAKRDVGVVFLFYVILGTMLAVAGIREGVAWWGQDHIGWEGPDKALFYLSCILAAAAIVPLAQLVAHVFLGPRLAAWVITYTFSALAAIGVVLLFTGGVAGPETDAWGSDWRIQSPALMLLIIFGAVLPGLSAMIGLAWHARRLPADDRDRIWAVAGGCALYVSVLALGAIGVPGAWVLLERSAYLLAAGAAWYAYGHHAQRASLIEAWTLSR